MIRTRGVELSALSVERCCRAAGVMRAQYYRPEPAAPSGELAVRAESILVRFPRYGYRRMATCLGMTVKSTRTLMRRHGLQAAGRRKVRTTHPVLVHGENLLGAAELSAPGQALIADVTCFALEGSRWGYAAVVLDAFTRQVVGWSVSSRNDTDLTLEALEMALAKGPLAQGWLHHSDRGSNYASHAYRGLVESSGGRCSYSAAGRPTQNARMESFFRTFKLEEAGLATYVDLADATSAFASYFTLYNSERLHSALNNVSPDQFLENYLLQHNP